LNHNEPKLWKSALCDLLLRSTVEAEQRATTAVPSAEEYHNPDLGVERNNNETYVELVERTYKTLSALEEGHIPASTFQRMHHSPPNPTWSYKAMYRRILNEQLRYVGPVFIMAGDVVLGQSYGLHLFEYRYRYMIHSIMSQRQPHPSLSSTAATTRYNGERIESNVQQRPIYFIHANQGNIRRSEMAILVQVMECDIYPDGRADIIVLPIHYVWIERSWLYDNHHHGNSVGPAPPTTMMIPTPTPPDNLYYAQCLKMGHAATSAMHHLQRQETLVHVMNRVIASGMNLAASSIVNQNDNMSDDDDDDDDDDSTVMTNGDDSEDEGS
jgi:hypothetical protein